ncbi:phage terminase large subunit (plasmid) [Skermanella rosea]|uniref:phage terminase large subunit n=1 Tax=Skermanella rosea TaxID=1817965 RepID=UPI001931D2E5|nr:phage terminase large subunit [Skermanella rosea]UEM08076.1 phage terminase large subunit [Skermanella rosea]
MKNAEHPSPEEIKRLKVIKWRCENDLLFFTRYFFKELQGRKFQVNAHHLAIVDALKKVESGEYPNLVINLPPRYGKTEIVVKMWIAQTFARNPKAKFIHVSYSDELALDNSNEAKEIITSPQFQRLWPVKIAESVDAKKLWKTTEGGGLKAGAAGGPITGFGAGLLDYEPGQLFAGAIISDDPLKPDDADSKTKRDKINRRFSGTLKSRRNNRHTPIVLVMQRLHEMDPSGYALGGHLGMPFAHLKIKALQEDGTALWETMHTAEELVAMKTADRYTFASQYQQEPTPAEGGIFQLAWLDGHRYGRRLDHYDMIVQSWDTASKKAEHNDPSCCTTWGVTRTGYHLLDVFCKRMEYPELKRTVISNALKWDATSVLIEDKASGMALIQDLKIDGSKLPVIAIEPEADKETRARAQAAQVESGLVSLPESAPWLLDYEQELTVFPNATHDDRVDSTSQFLKWIRTKTQSAGPRVRAL